MINTVLSFSIQQIDLFAAAVKADSNIVLQAVAGSGKTTTIKEACNRMKQANPSLKIRFVAFNKAIVEEIKAKVPAELAEVGTMHSFCYSAWRQVAKGVKVDAYAKSKQVADVIFAQLSDSEVRNLKSFVEKLIQQAKNAGVGILFNFDDTSKYQELVSKFDLDMEIGENPWQAGSQADVDQGIELAKQGVKLHAKLGYEIIDFTDMLWLPLLHNVKFWQVDRLLVDEAQDLNALQMLAAKKMMKPSARAIFVGDSNQAIYGFTGADSNSLETIKQQFGCIEMPLTVTYRCPKSVVNVARQWVNHITAADTSPEGIVSSLDYSEMMGQAFTADDAIVCRKTAPLVEAAYSLIAKGVACHVEGREIGQGLIALVNKWKKVRTIQQLLVKLNDYRDKQIQALQMKGRELAADALSDRVETICIIAEQLSLDSSVKELTDKIQSIFADNAANLTLTTIHKSKGREYDRVFWLGKESYQPSKFARQQWQLDQEYNLMYVAATRAKEQLIFVSAKPE